MRSKEKREAEKNEARNASANKKAAAPQPKRTSKVGVFCFAAAIFVLFSLTGTALVSLVAGLSAWACLVGACFGAIGCYSIRIANQWERVVILRLGKYNRQVGPGLYFIIPIIEYAAAHVDQRIITTPFIAEEALTADLVPLDIDAVLFWMVWDPKSACVEVEDYSSAIWWAAQTALRDAVGRINLAEVAMP